MSYIIFNNDKLSKIKNKCLYSFLIVMFNFSNSQSEHSEKAFQEANSSEQSTDEYSPSERPKRVTKMSSKLSESDESSDESSQVTKTPTYEKRWF